ncbi:MAG: DinB family protein [Dehalococcoidia bacterium]
MASDSTPGSLGMIRWQWAFQEWATTHLLDAAGMLPEEALRAPGAIPGGRGDGSTWETLAHLVGAEQQWLERWLGDADSTFRSGKHYRSLHELRTASEDTSGRRRVWLSGLGPAALSERPTGEEPLWMALLHVANHTTHHRAEACAALTTAGAPPQGVDMLEWIDAGCPGAEGP